jgi:hypothetical protein
VTASLPSEVQSVFAQFSTTELTTVDEQGQPVSWPVRASYSPGAPCIDLTSEVEQLGDNPLVGLLFCEPEGSGLSDPPMVFVQGSAHVETECLRVRPERVYVWPSGDISDEPKLYDAHMEEVRSGHSEEPDRYHADPAGGARAWSDQFEALGTGVLSIISPDGFPFAVRVPVHVDPEARMIMIDGAPTGIPFQPGLACLSADDLQIRGDLVYAEASWALVPHEVRSPGER